MQTIHLFFFFKLDKCGLIQTHRRNVLWDIYFNLKFCVWKQDMPCASEKIIIAEVRDDANSKWECECFKYFSWCKLNLIQGTTHAGVLLSYWCFLWWKLSLIHCNQHSQHLKKYKKTKTLKQDRIQYGKQQKIQSSNRSKERELNLINEKKSERKEEKGDQCKNLIDT